MLKISPKRMTPVHMGVTDPLRCEKLDIGRLFADVRTEHQFLRHVDEAGDILYDEEVVRLSVLRYEHLWMPAVAALPDGAVLVPPLDIAFVWHCHVLCPTRYFSDWQEITGSVPDYKFPDLAAPTAATTENGLHVDLSTKADALQSMWRSLERAISLPSRTYNVDHLAKLPTSCMSYDVASAALRQKVFFYQVSLPHYGLQSFIHSAIARYITFLSIRRANPGTKLCPTYDIDLVWHSHMSRPHQYKKETELRVGVHLSHDDSINDRSAGSELQALQRTTERLFSASGQEFFSAGGMFRGIPKQLTPEERDACLPLVPPSSVSFALRDAAWDGSEPGSQKARPQASITGWRVDRTGWHAALDRRRPWSPLSESIEVPCGSKLTLRLKVNTEAQPGLMRFQAMSACTASAEIDMRPFVQGRFASTTVPVRVPVKLTLPPRLGMRTAIVTLAVQPAFGKIDITPPRPLRTSGPAAVNAEHTSAAAHVSQPSLLLPPAAVGEVDSDVAESRCFSVNLRSQKLPDGSRVKPMMARITNSVKHLVSVVEVFAGGDGGMHSTPAATAHTINLAQLPAHPKRMCQNEIAWRRDVGPAGALRSHMAERAFLIRSGDKDWGVLYGWWRMDGKVDCNPPLEQPEIELQVLADKGANYQTLSSVKLGLGDGRSAVLQVHHNGSVSLGADGASGVLAPSATEAGRLEALMATLSLCKSLLLALCMPCARTVRHPQHVRMAMRRAGQCVHKVAQLRRGHWGLVTPALCCTRLPTNGYISKRLWYQVARGDAQAMRAALPWYGSTQHKTVDEVGEVFWRGPAGIDSKKMQKQRDAWTKLANKSSHRQCDGCTTAACGGACAGGHGSGGARGGGAACGGGGCAGCGAVVVGAVAAVVVGVVAVVGDVNQWISSVGLVGSCACFDSVDLWLMGFCACRSHAQGLALSHTLCRDPAMHRTTEPLDV
eukprot:jgi/Ulvmu1/5465/UM023_0001.1